jgi:hypothetical protein
MTIATDHTYREIFQKATDAKLGGHDAWRVQSTGEKITVALILNRADWLAEMDYTIAEAIDRAGHWISYVPAVAKELSSD